MLSLLKNGNDKHAFGSFSLGLKYKILNAQLKYGVDNILRMRSSVDAGGLSGGLVASFPDQSSSKVSLGYVHPNAIANFTTSFGLFRNPLFALSEVVGNHLWSLRFDASFDVTAQSFRSMDFASSLISDKFIASFNSYNMADLPKVYLYQSVMNSAYAVELSRQRSTNTSRISIGYEHRFGSEVLVKSRVDSNGTVAALFQLKQSLPAESINTLRVCFLISKEIPGVRYMIRDHWNRACLARQCCTLSSPSFPCAHLTFGSSKTDSVYDDLCLMFLDMNRLIGLDQALLQAMSAVQVLALTEAPEIERKVVVVPGMGSCPRHGSVGKIRFDPLRTGRTLLKE
ncbi:hypothetical protein F2Q70_00023637 [Brassica cretica]|uniref:Uncharacterized protein n=1 Tax=Brassica cretica TaxID=69181 RepID=A0A8S9GUV6_BRACR|nr:hypothetical protein F2Q70_00023637 [Brassica cretica]KAF2559215.1 hypothetical protein F2Q68_00017965 [Brassica cretica]